MLQKAAKLHHSECECFVYLPQADRHVIVSLGAFAGVKSLGDLGRLLEELPRPFVDFLKVQAIIRGAATKLGSSLHDRLRINATYAQKVSLRVSWG